MASFINAKNERYWVKFHLKTQQGIKNLTDQEAEAIVAKDRESNQRDLYESIEKKDFPRWTFYVQIMPEKDAAKCPYHRDGAMRVDGNYGSTLGCEPNSYGEWKEPPEFSEPPLKLEGDAYHWNFREDDTDYYTQPGKLFRLMSADQQKALFGNTARAIANAPKEVKIRHIGKCLKADPAYGKRVADALGIKVSEIKA